MPYLKIECSKVLANEIDLNSMLKAFNQIISETVNAPLALCKSYLSLTEHSTVGDGLENLDFVIFKLTLIEGRTHETKQAVVDKLVNCLNKLTQNIEHLKCHFSFVLNEISKKNYHFYESINHS